MMSSEFTSRLYTSRTTWNILPMYHLIRDQGPICDGMEGRFSLREFVKKPKQKPNVITAGLDTEQKNEDNELKDIVVQEIEEHAVAHRRADLRNQLTSAANQEEISNEGQQVLRLLQDAGVEVEYVPDKTMVGILGQNWCLQSLSSTTMSLARQVPPYQSQHRSSKRNYINWSMNA